MVKTVSHATQFPVKAALDCSHYGFVFLFARFLLQSCEIHVDRMCVLTCVACACGCRSGSDTVKVAAPITISMEESREDLRPLLTGYR